MALTVVRPAPERRPALWLDGLVLVGIVALVLGATSVFQEWRQPRNLSVRIDLSLAALPRYALYSFARAWIAYFLSFVFTILIASWAYYDERARRFIIVALDILQSLPVLAFLPVFEFALVDLFPHNNVGLELVCVLAIFTSQVWNMTFSYYDSLRGTPADFRMLGQFYNFNWWQRLWRIELPFGAQGLLYNSMVSMAGGWFFLAASEAATIGNANYQVPGVGSYISAAYAQHNLRAEIYALIAMSVIILVVDRLIWWPLIVWSRKFKLDDFGAGTARKSPFQLWMARSLAVQKLSRGFQALRNRLVPPPLPPSEATSLAPPGAPPSRRPWLSRGAYGAFLLAWIVLIGWGADRLVALLSVVRAAEWLQIARAGGISFLRVLAAVVIGTLWTVPFGIWIGLNPRISSRLQPLIQFVASFPSTMIYPALLMGILAIGGNLYWGAVVLILFGTQWYILFNVQGAAAAIPNDMICCADILHLHGWRRWTKFLLPAVLPSLVTGWITAAGGAWNATIVSEALSIGDKSYQTFGLGAYINQATSDGNFPRLYAAALVMSVFVVVVNRTVWKRIQALANERCRFIT